ncbi:TetR family transcriptional regulator [Streptomyces sp. NPDC048568]|uniref:TetR family transcriptional regulator n=1 Tax=Streptomyces sp. NPDC048568 TaxID=3365571 RepID=UPI0037232F75
MAFTAEASQARGEHARSDCHAAGRLFAERGYFATTVQEIAALADGSPAGAGGPAAAAKPALTCWS